MINKASSHILQRYRPSKIIIELGCTRQYFYLIREGKATPSLELAIKIMKATGGLVPVSTWYPEFKEDDLYCNNQPTINPMKKTLIICLLYFQASFGEISDKLTMNCIKLEGNQRGIPYERCENSEVIC